MYERRDVCAAGSAALSEEKLSHKKREWGDNRGEEFDCGRRRRRRRRKRRRRRAIDCIDAVDWVDGVCC